MHVIVDRNICQNHGQCCFAASEIFTLGDDGRMIYVAQPTDDLRSKAEDAADTCPTQAIVVSD